ncbi:hypothetical protein DV704_01075 [Meiothermus sp. QL-1]|uniref:hypothetical protein n=1 Tax=Meiothermus sp. QL-1 TaxID=2058095 RepID=UPI000E0CB8B7|nr:hypothetical protein [Meiothermus sp. QL-1]RDI96446.1 hypothetical protein DV704_01075 [Meiothermus sp. QL-1]
MLGLRDRCLGALVGLLFVPFVLQLLGWAGTPLGGGPCGPLASDTGRLLLEQPQAFFYAQVMLWGIALLMANGFLILMLGFMHNGAVPRRQARPFVRLALGLGFFTALVYVLTHTTGLPAPSPVGWVLGDPQPADAVGVLILLALLVQVVLAVRWQAEAPAS